MSKVEQLTEEIWDGSVFSNYRCRAFVRVMRNKP